MRRSSVVLALLLAALVVVPNAQAAGKKYRVVMQWTEADSMGQFVMTLHAKNLLDDLGQDNVQLEVLAYGPAIFAATTTRPQAKFADAIQKLSERGVVFHACQHAMDFLGVRKDELQPAITPVPGAMSYLTKKYNEGWQTLRP